MNNPILKSLVITTILAFLALVIWRAEIIYRVGWASLDWIYKYYLISPTVITFLVVLATLAPFYIEKKEINFNHLIKPFVALSIIGIVSYYVARIPMFSLLFGNNPYILISIALLNGGLFYFIINKTVANVPILYGFLVILAVVAPLFQSLLFNGSPVDSIKEGYPFFFIVFNLGVLSTFAAYYLNKPKIEH